MSDMAYKGLQQGQGPGPVQSSTRIRVGGIMLNVETGGSGPAIVLIHGFPDALSQWRGVAPLLQQAGYRTIAFDVRGFGHSDAPQGQRHYAMERVMEDIDALLDALGEQEPVHLIGHDWGAVLAWNYALTRPSRVRSLVAISVGHPQAYGRAGLMQKLKGWYALAFKLPLLPEAALLSWRGALFRKWIPEHPALDEVIADMARPGRLTAGMNLYRANLFKMLFGRWPRCKVPVLGLWSNGDKFLTEGQMTESARLCDAGWEYQRLENCAHWVPLERPDWVAQQVLRWLAHF